MKASPATPVTVMTRPTRVKERPVTWWKKTSENGMYMPIPTALMPMPRSSDRSPATFASTAVAVFPLNRAMTTSPPDSVAGK